MHPSPPAPPPAPDRPAADRRRVDPHEPGSIAVVLGTRPEIIKLAPVIDLLGRRARVVHTGQHYDESLARVFFEAFGLGDPHYELEIGGAARGRQIGEATSLLDEHFARRPPAAVVVQGDTNTVLAAALAANARSIPLVHVEAGLRSFDRAMPEEHNRVLTDHLSDLCCAPTDVSRANLAAEGITGERVVVTGNTIIEAVERLLPGRDERAALLDRFGAASGRYALATLHRPENVDNPDRLAAILAELAGLGVPVVLPLHPRTAARVAGFGLAALLEPLRVLDPVGYREFLGLAAECALLVSDSGGIQEEASIVKRPVIVVRNSTERPEVAGTFAELVRPGPAIGELARRWLAELPGLHARLAGLPSPYGDGTAARRTVAAMDDMLGTAP